MSAVLLPLYQFGDGRVIDLREVYFISEVDPSDDPWRPGFNIYLKRLDSPMGFAVSSLREKTIGEYAGWLAREHARLIKAWGEVAVRWAS